MQTVSRLSRRLAIQLSIPFLTGLLSLALVPEADAQRMRGGARAPAHEGPAVERATRTATPGEQGRPVEGDPLLGDDTRRDVRVDERRDGDRVGCRRGVRRAGVACDYYYDDDGDYYEDDVETTQTQSGSAPRQAAPAPAAAKMAPAPQPETIAEEFTPHASKQLRNELIAAHKKWVAAQNHLDAVSKQLADAEYKAYKTGGSVDPALAERRQQARAEVSAAHAAMEPLVEQGRKAGISSGVLELYEQAHE